jgi:hypothetical protein
MQIGGGRGGASHAKDGIDSVKVKTASRTFKRNEKGGRRSGVVGVVVFGIEFQTKGDMEWLRIL